jgi:hypothetical protein
MNERLTMKPLILSTLLSISSLAMADVEIIQTPKPAPQVQVMPQPNFTQQQMVVLDPYAVLRDAHMASRMQQQMAYGHRGEVIQVVARTETTQQRVQGCYPKATRNITGGVIGGVLAGGAAYVLGGGAAVTAIAGVAGAVMGSSPQTEMVCGEHIVPQQYVMGYDVTVYANGRYYTIPMNHIPPVGATINLAGI